MNSLSLTLNKYYMSFMGHNEQHTTDWGWFIDFDFNAEPIKVKNSNLKSIYCVEPLKEHQRIRSLKSMRNLNEVSMIFEMDEDDNEDDKLSNTSQSLIIVNTITMFVFGCFYYYLK